MRNTVASEHVFEHFTVRLDVPHDHGHIVRALSRSKKVHDIATDLLDFFITAGCFHDPQPIVGQKGFVRFKEKKLFEDGTRWMRRSAEFRKSFFCKRFVLNESLPRPLRKLRRLNVRRRIEKHDGPSIRQCLDERSHEYKLRFGKIVDRVQDDSLKALEPSNCPFPDTRCGKFAAVLWIVEGSPSQGSVVLIQTIGEKIRA